MSILSKDVTSSEQNKVKAGYSAADLMYLLYSLLLTVGMILLTPLFVIDAFRTRKYITGLAQRLGRLPAINFHGHPVIWLHCVSVGETTAARPLVRALADRFPSYRLVISTTTITGQRVAKDIFGGEAAAVFYFPIDWACTVRRVLRVLQPEVLLIMETELWPRLLYECRARAIPVILVNGRISKNSFRRYKWIRTFISRVLDDLLIALMQSEQDAERIRQLGMAAERVMTPGNLKFDSAETAVDDGATDTLRRRFGFYGSQRLIVAASTHASEERVIIEAFKRLKSSIRNARLLIAPRHPERFDEVASLLDESGLTWSRRSNQSREQDQSCEVVLLDTVGELRAVYPLADIAFVGGSIASHGGHNVLEPAALGVCVVTGAHTENFAAVTKALLAEKSIIQMPNLPTSEISAELASVLVELLSDEARRREIGQRAQAVCSRNTGATERTVRVLAKVLAQSPTRESVPLSSVPITTAK